MFRLLIITSLLISACQEKTPSIFKAVSNGTCSVKINGSHEAFVGIYGFPASLGSHQLTNDAFATVPLYYPTSEAYLSIENDQFRLFLTPGDSIVINAESNELKIEKSNFQEINQFYVSSPTDSKEFFSLIHSLSLQKAQSVADSLFLKDVAELEKSKNLPTWFYDYERSGIRSKTFFPVVDRAKRDLSPNAFKQFFESEFDFADPFSVHQYSNYSSIMIYLEVFNSAELNNEVKEAATWLVGIEERTAQTMNYLPFEYRDINLANQLILRLEAGIITRDNLHDYYDLFTDKNWYIILEDRLPGESEELKEGDTQPYFYLPSISGEFFDSKELLGKYSYINFWSFWCNPCLEKFPKENELAEKHPEINYVNICLDADSTRWHSFSQENISPQTINLWANENWSKILKEKFNVMSLPRATLSDENGQIFIRTPSLSKVQLDSLFGSISSM